MACPTRHVPISARVDPRARDAHERLPAHPSRGRDRHAHPGARGLGGRGVLRRGRGGRVPAQPRAVSPGPEARRRRLAGPDRFPRGVQLPARARRGRLPRGPAEGERARGVTTLPRWTDRDDAPAALLGDWDLFLRRLRDHEEGHQRIAIGVGADLLQDVAALEAPDCEALERSALAVAASYQASVTLEQQGWDAETRHGLEGGD
ncbi:MAG: DUF922 domain-containing protein [Gemmatimonadetes bacterium]|nr:DUF922 domain-containing protein [Gemmatimonadota bacterium]